MTTHLHRTDALRAAGYPYSEIRRLLRANELIPVRRGTYLAGERPDAPGARHRLAVLAAVGDLGADAVVSHVSAAVLHGLPIWEIPLNRVHVTKNRDSNGRRSHRVHLHVAALLPADIVVVGRIVATSLARTVVDIARTAPFEQAVVVADAALRTGLLDWAELAEVLARLARRRGIPRAHRAVVFADGRAESVGESRSRVAIARAGLPAPELQREIVRADCSLSARVDFLWRDQGVVGEFDGEVKYRRSWQPGRAPEDVVIKEKLREDKLRAAHLGVVRWSWHELRGFAVVARRIRAELEYGHPSWR